MLQKPTWLSLFINCFVFVFWCSSSCGPSHVLFSQRKQEKKYKRLMNSDFNCGWLLDDVCGQWWATLCTSVTATRHLFKSLIVSSFYPTPYFSLIVSSIVLLMMTTNKLEEAGSKSYTVRYGNILMKKSLVTKRLEWEEKMEDIILTSWISFSTTCTVNIMRW